MLAGLIGHAGDRGSAEGAYFGWWNFATKLNLALAAGLALPLLAVFGYTPGARDDSALGALTIASVLMALRSRVSEEGAVAKAPRGEPAGPWWGGEG